MVVVEIKFIPYNEVETVRVLAHSIEEAEKYFRIIEENECNIKNVTILHSYIVAEPTSYSIRAKEENGFPSCLDWKDKKRSSDGVVMLWTDLPESIKKKIKKTETAA